MKRLLIALFAAVAVAGLAYAGFETLAGNAKYEGKTGIKDLLTALDANFALSVAQSDTNATTTATLYTPRYIGDKLIGKTGGTNTVWVGRGTTTNDWQAITPPAE